MIFLYAKVTILSFTSFTTLFRRTALTLAIVLRRTHVNSKYQYKDKKYLRLTSYKMQIACSSDELHAIY